MPATNTALKIVSDELVAPSKPPARGSIGECGEEKLTLISERFANLVTYLDGYVLVLEALSSENGGTKKYDKLAALCKMTAHGPVAALSRRCLGRGARLYPRAAFNNVFGELREGFAQEAHERQADHPAHDVLEAIDRVGSYFGRIFDKVDRDTRAAPTVELKL